MREIFSSNKTFLENLPNWPFRKVIIRTLIAALIGLLFVVVISFLIQLIFGGSLGKNIKLGFIERNLVVNVTFLLVFLFLFYQGRVGNIFKQLFLSKDKKSPMIMFCIVAVFVLINMIFNLIISKTYNHERLESLLNNLPKVLSQETIFITIFTILTFCLMAFFEEFFFRFTLFRFFRKTGLLLALFISSILFAMVHGLGNSVFTFLFGVTLALYYEYSNSFIGLVIIHAGYNIALAYLVPIVLTLIV